MFHNKMVYVIFFFFFLVFTNSEHLTCFYFCSLKRRVFKTQAKGELVIKAKPVLSRSVFSKEKSNTFKKPKPFK